MEIRNAILAVLLPGLWFFALPKTQAQVTDGEKHLRNISLDGTTGWKTENNLTISFSQVSLTNWSAGGQNSMSVNGRFNGFYNYKKERMAWDNQVDLGYGLLKQGKTIWQKTDDRFELMSKLGYRLSESLNLAGLANLGRRRA